MRIKYDMTDNYFKCYNESQGIIMNKDEIIRNPKFKLRNYIEKGLINLLLLVIIFLCSRLFVFIAGNNIVSKVLDIICIITLVFLVLYFIVFYLGFSVEKRKKHVGNLEIDAEGIKDFSDTGMVIGFSWDNIKGIVIKKHTINILTDNSIYFFIDVKYKERLLLAVERYNKDLLIIDKTK